MTDGRKFRVQPSPTVFRMFIRNFKGSPKEALTALRRMGATPDQIMMLALERWEDPNELLALLLTFRSAKTMKKALLKLGWAKDGKFIYRDLPFEKCLILAKRACLQIDSLNN